MCRFQMKENLMLCLLFLLVISFLFFLSSYPLSISSPIEGGIIFNRMTGTSPTRYASSYPYGYDSYGWMYPRYPKSYLGATIGMVPTMGIVGPTSMPPVYNKSKVLGKTMAYKEGESFVHFESFDGAFEKLKALTFIQQFDNNTQRHSRRLFFPLILCKRFLSLSKGRRSLANLAKNCGLMLSRTR